MWGTQSHSINNDNRKQTTHLKLNSKSNYMTIFNMKHKMVETANTEIETQWRRHTRSYGNQAQHFRARI